jgi:hypothetical protein
MWEAGGPRPALGKTVRPYQKNNYRQRTCFDNERKKERKEEKKEKIYQDWLRSSWKFIQSLPQIALWSPCTHFTQEVADN